VINVVNNVQNNGSSLHFHGVRQLNNNPNDGVNSITQCPTAPGQTTTYTWKATQYGTSWYHSHYSLQAWDGVSGGILIRGPATANYDTDLGVMALSDWNHETADALYPTAQLAQRPPTLDGGLINGTNTYGSVGQRWAKSVVPGQRYLLRLVNTAIDSFFLFSIDAHNLTVIAADFVPIKPYNTSVLSLGIGQRYDVIFTANQASVASDFWLRAVPDTYCSENANGDNIRGIIHYGSSTGIPSTTGHAGYSTSTNCIGEIDAKIVPYVSKTVGLPLAIINEDMEYIPNPDGLQRWYLDGSTFFSAWNNPTALQIVNGIQVLNKTANAITVPNLNIWTYVVIETVEPFSHPIHLHGHDFYVLAKGSGSYNAANAISNLFNPPRRDTSMLPGNGFMLLAFLSDNPGIWLMHCHIGWHLAEGFSMQIIEHALSIPSLYSKTALTNTCSAWNTYAAKNGVSQMGLLDDGI